MAGRSGSRRRLILPIDGSGPSMGEGSGRSLETMAETVFVERLPT